jgi:predicted ATPase/DNA-binding XRE family transcriptional regulator
MGGQAMPPPDDPQAFGVLLKHYRAAAGLSQEELAERAGLSRRGISDLERGSHQLPYPSTIRRLSQALDLTRAEHARFVSAAAGDASGADRRTARRVSRIPVPPSSFIGRQSDLAELSRLLHTYRLVTVTGPGGAGKTRLALEFVRRYLSDFPDGAWYVDLAPVRDQSQILQAIDDVTRVSDARGETTIESLTEMLQGRATLLILDNCEHLASACAEVAEQLLAVVPTVALLATSREPLRITGERVWRVQGLSVPRWPLEPDDVAGSESVELFVDRARATRSEFRLTDYNMHAVAQVCGRLDGLPLAIELAATRIDALSVQDIALRLNDRFRLLTGGPRAAPARHQTMRGTLAWSYDLLGSTERCLFERLSVFDGSFSLAAGEAMGAWDGLDRPDIADSLGRLVATSLLQAEHRDAVLRYRMLETVREFARAALPANTLSQARGKHAEHYLEVAERASAQLRGPQQVRWLDELETEQHNLRQALDWASEGGHAETALRLGAALWRFWLSRGHVVDADRLLTQLLQLPAVGVPARREVLFAAGVAALQRSSTRLAESRFRELLEASDAAGDTTWRAAAATQLGYVARRRGDLVEARKLHKSALRIRRSHGLRNGIVISLQALAGIALDACDPAAARQLGEEALSMARELGDLRSVATCLTTLARSDRAKDDFGSARKRLDEALRLARRMRDPYLVLGVLEAREWLARASGDESDVDRLSVGIDRWRHVIGEHAQERSPGFTPEADSPWIAYEWVLVDVIIGEVRI